MSKLKHFLLAWQTSKSKYEVVTGEDPADAMNNAGYSSGALMALDYYADVSAVFNGKVLAAALREVAGWTCWTGAYRWKRESCAKLARMGLLLPIDGGWIINDAGRVVLEKLL